MRNIKSLIAGAAFAVVAASAASAADVTIGLSEDGGPITAFSGGSNFNITGVSFGTFGVNNVTGTAFPSLPFPELLDSNAIDVSAAATPGVNHTLTVYVAGLSNIATTLGPEAFASDFTSNVLTNGWSVDETTLFSNSNLAFVGTDLDTHLFTNIGSFSASASALVGPNFSIIERYDISTGGFAGSANSTIDVSEVPAPILGAGLPGLIAAGAAMFAFARRRRAVRA